MKHILVALGLAIGLAAPAWADILREPPKIEFTAPASAETVKTAIITAATKRKWQAAEVAPGQIDASITVRGRHMVKVAIDYTDRSVAIRYLDSADMGYEAAEGRTYIHGNYNKWTETLANDIRKQLGTEQIAVN
ncbi:hypothetical protein [Jeongeupia chitinilytica]|uniref:DUF1499 domain-containing protein n=1 Tax=Jeongeupia chitinilytica TaxID=1041641 RepID=A0ABQ3H1P6_9NEIS|nr:hypothetical protein [Jeongeupia chitinilytica]GHD65031.1 hypothetical protein GCM10007350_25130 [Jeongeupia chitinilytica]